MTSSKNSILTHLAARRLKLIADGQLPEEVYAKARNCFADTLGAISLGLAGPLAASMCRQASQDIDRPQSHAFAIGKSTSVETAAFTNAVLAHTAVRDDMHVGAVAHLGSIVVPSALAVAQRYSWTDKQLLTAIIGGYEMGALLGTSLSGKMIPHFRASGMVGAFAAAGAIACGEGSDEDTTSNALSLAVNAACGINQWACEGTPELFIHMGNAARLGITSYSLAKDGVRASSEALEGKHGLFTALGVGSDGTTNFENWIKSSALGRGILDVKWKPMACCNFTQTTTALALKISRMPGFGSAASDIHSIRITTTSAAVRYPGCNNAGPLTSALHGKMSIQYGCGIVLLLGGVLSEASWDPLSNPGCDSLMAKCTLAASPDFDAAYQQGKQPARIQVTLEDGRVFKEGLADVPWLDSNEMLERCLAEISERSSAEKARQFLDACSNSQGLKDSKQLVSWPF